MKLQQRPQLRSSRAGMAQTEVRRMVLSILHQPFTRCQLPWKRKYPWWGSSFYNSWGQLLGRNLAMSGQRQLGNEYLGPQGGNVGRQHTLAFTTVKTDNKVATLLYCLRILHWRIIWCKTDVKSFIHKASHMGPKHGAKKHCFCLLVDYFLADKFGPKLPCSWILDVQLPSYGTINLKNSGLMIHNWVFIQHLKTIFSPEEIFLNGIKRWLQKFQMEIK